ncbi:MAG: sugar ABC transporter ATP-binding protein [Anaerolineae bacterium]|nr:sugar ABC transporter ATP-binding protein [Anaerolineae bacterium]
MEVRSQTPIIQFESITKSFAGVTALDRVSFAVQAGEIHAIIGENGAGKSTLMNILTGELQPDSGRIVYKGTPHVITSPAAAQQLGISCVYQELALCGNLSIADNISLRSTSHRLPIGMVNRRQYQNNAQAVLSRLGMGHMDVRQMVNTLTLAQQQLVDIAKALSVQSDVLILDEPNSALTGEETEHLFQVLRQLKADGVTILYISHRLEEVLTLADRITVMRDGKYVDTLNASEATVDTLISKMVGRVMDRLYKRSSEPTVRPHVMFEAKGLSAAPRVHEISFQLHAGEVVGLAGLPDAGREELVECLYGLRKLDGGQILVNGQAVGINSPDAAIRHGLALVPADRRGAGALLKMTVQNNIVAANTGAVSRFGILRGPIARQMARSYVDQLSIRTAGLEQQMATLSGGNQQKTILARGLSTAPHVFLLHEPTRGIDVGAKAEIYTILTELVRNGASILIISSELPELMGQCDRILVMHAGRLTGHFTRAEFAEEPILACAMGQATH